MVNQDNIRKWVDALRSGEFEQGLQYLTRRKHDASTWSHCCLGVACEVAIASGVKVDVRVVEDFDMMKSYDGNLAFLPDAVQQWLGVNEDNVWLLRSDGSRSSASRLNDITRQSFPKIGDAIERTFLTQQSGGENEEDIPAAK